MLVEGALFIAATLLTIYIVLYFVNIYKKPYQGTKAFYQLSTPSQLVLPTNDFVWSSRNCSLRFMIYVGAAPKTVTKVDCIESSGSSARSFAPNCEDYRYKACACVGTNCQPCALDSSSTGYLSKLLSIGDSVELWASGYTSQNDKPYVPAILKVRTGTDSSQHYMESISLPAIPLQKWTVVTIVKEGRRFDVYYGAKLQVSNLTNYFPIEPDTTLQWLAGNSRWRGQIGLFMGFQKAMYAEDVLRDVESIVDTRGIPYYSEDHQSGVDLSIPTCFFGNCSLPDVKPPNQFTVYDTHLA